jgi:class 3 adenylate cyclase
VVAQINERLLDERLASLESARAWSPRVISKLESHIRTAEDQALFRINPLRFAEEKNMVEEEAIDLFLHASAAGLFEMNWLLVCPLCSRVVESFHALKNVHNHYHCNVCQEGFDAKLDEFITITFTSNPAVRDIKFHHPEQLSAHEYFFEYGSTADGRLPDGTPFVKAQESVTKQASHLPPGEVIEMTIEAPEGTLLGFSAEGGVALVGAIAGSPAQAPQRFDIVIGDKACAPVSPTLAPGRMTFAVRNAKSERDTFVVAVLPPGFDTRPVLQFAPFLTGKRLLTTQTFRQLFRSEVIGASEGIGVKNIALLFTDLKGSTALYERIGDLDAFALVQQHFERLRTVTVRHKGAIIKTIGDAVMAAFLEPADAVRAALAMREEIAASNRDQQNKELVLKIGIHTGAAIAVTLNERLDYFGQTVNIAARVQSLADADEIFVSENVFEADGVDRELAHLSTERQVARLRGIHEDMPVFRIQPRLRATL